jgi:hypothetical protein
MLPEVYFMGSVQHFFVLQVYFGPDIPSMFINGDRPAELSNAQ